MRLPAPHRGSPPSRSARRLALALVLLVLPAAACGAAGRHDPRESLPDSLRDYHDHLVWSRYSDAAGYLPADQRNVFIGAFDAMGSDVHFTEYDIGTIDLNAEAKEATIQVTLKWYRAPYYVIHETRVRETWRLDEENDYWWLVSRTDPDAPLPRDDPAAAARD